MLLVVLYNWFGLIWLECEEFGLLFDCELLLVDDDGKLVFVDVIEDELLLVLLLVLINLDSVLLEEVISLLMDDSVDEGCIDNLFVVLCEFKK